MGTVRVTDGDDKWGRYDFVNFDTQADRVTDGEVTNGVTNGDGTILSTILDEGLCEGKMQSDSVANSVYENVFEIESLNLYYGSLQALMKS